MSYTTITARITDQALQLVNIPLIASGSKGVLQVKCEFDSTWDGYSKAAVFYRKNTKVYHIPLINGIATVPHEVLADDGHFFFGILGTAENLRTTEVVRLIIKQGAINASTAEPEDPTPDIYQLLLSAYGKTEKALAVERARIDQLVALRGGGEGVMEYQIAGDYVTGTLYTNGAAAFISIAFSAPPLAGNSEITDMCLPSQYAPLGLVTFDSLPNSPAAGVAIHPRTGTDDEWAGITITNSSAEDITDAVEFEGYYELETMSIPEIADLCVGFDGTKYKTAGSSVRGQINKLKDATTIIKTAAGNSNINLTETAAFPIQSLTVINPGLMAGERIMVGLANKNLFDVNMVHSSFRINETNDINIHAEAITGGIANSYQRDIFLGTSGDSKPVPSASRALLPYLPAGTYTLSYTVVEGSTKLRAWLVASDGSVTQLTGTTTNPSDTFTLEEGSRVTLRRSGSSAFYVTNVQIEPGSVATEYSEHEGITVTVTVPGDTDVIDVQAQAGGDLSTYKGVTRIYNDQVADMQVVYVSNVEELVHAFDTRLTAAEERAATADTKAGTLMLDGILLEQGSLNYANGMPKSSTIRVRTATFLKSEGQTISLPDGFYVSLITYYDANHNFARTSYPAQMQSFVLNEQYDFAKFTICAVDESEITPEAVKRNLSLEELNSKLSDLSNQTEQVPPLVKFDITRNMIDVTEDVKGWAAQIVKDETAGYWHTMEQVYALYDSLVDNHPDMWERIDDVAATVGLAYPTYANGITQDTTVTDPYTGAYDSPAAVTYKVTPSYKTRMYIYKHGKSAMLNGANDAGVPRTNAKKKLLLISGVHGDEKAAPFNTYLFAKRLSEIAEEDDYFKFGQAFDVYIIPCVNGYGMYHNQRWNANGVNINRNYSAGWLKASSETEAVYGVNCYGLGPASEFETQLVEAVTRYVAPDMAVDAHNYTPSTGWQFYTYVQERKFLRLAYQSAVDCSLAFKKAYPVYFGTKNEILKENDTEQLHDTSGANGYVTKFWLDEGIKLSAIIEICYAIQYNGGEHYSAGIDPYGAATFAVGEFTLRNQILRFGQYILDMQ